MKKVNMNFIPQNVAPIGAKRVAIFDTNGNEVATLPLGGLAPKYQGNKLYSFGALSDVHLPYAQQNASSDFQEALTYFNNVANVDFICISGDMSDEGTDAEWLDYKSHVDTYSPNTPVHLSAGNHDTASDISYDYPIQYTGNPLWYSFEQNNDVFIMFGLRQWQGDNVFYNEALQWLYKTLEDNRDKRCFVFQHEMRLDGCGNAHGLYGWDGLAGRNGQVFLSLMEHYKNVIWFHGHSHTPFRLQSTQPTPIANYDRLHGCHSVHIPSLAIPRHGNSDVLLDAEGYVVDVYENGIHLRGIDFIEKEFVLIASYWIDTTPIEIPANSYVDTRGVIKERGISLPKGSELIMNQRYSYSGKGLVTDEITPLMFTAIIPVMPNTDYVLKIKNSNIEIPSASSSVVYGIDSSKMPAQQINGSGNISSMTTGITLSEDKKSADITFTTAGNVSYIALSLRALVSGTLKEGDIVNYVIELEESENNDQPGITMPEGTEVKVNTQFSESGGGFREMSGYCTYVIPVEPETSYKFNIANIPADNLTEDSATMYELTADQVFNSRINGSKYIHSMTDTTISEDGTSAEVNFITTSNARYIAVSIIPGSVNPDDIRITLKAQGDITDTVTWTMDKRLSSVGDPDKDEVGAMVSDYISVNHGDVINIYGISSLDAKPFYINFYKDGTFVYNIALSNPDVNPEDNGYAYAEYKSLTKHLTIQIKDMPVNSIRVCCVASTVTVYKNAEMTVDKPIEGFSTDLLQTYEVKLNQRWSGSSNAYVDQVGLIAFSVPYSEIEGKTLRLIGFENVSDDGSAWYAYNSSGTLLGRIAKNGSGIVWDSSALIDNGDGSYDIPISPEIFIVSGSTKPLTETPATVYITMRVDNSSITSFDGCRILVSDKDPR